MGPLRKSFVQKGCKKKGQQLAGKMGRSKERFFFFNEKAISMLISPAAIYGAPDCGARYFTCDNAFNPPNGFAM